MFLLSTSISPEQGSNNLVSRFKTVDFPEPLDPISATIWPGCIVMLKFSRILF
jgi:hypothetical protein